MPLVVIDALMSIRMGSPPVGMPTAMGSGVNTALRPPNGATLASAGSELRIVTIMPAAVARGRKVGEAGDVMAAADGDGAEAVTPRPLDRQIHRAHREPHARQRAAVPGHRGAAVGDDVRFARRLHAALGDLLQIAAGELQPVGGVAHQVGLHQHLRDQRGLVAVAARGGEEPAGESKEIGGAVALGRCVHGFSLIGLNGAER